MQQAASLINLNIGKIGLDNKSATMEMNKTISDRVGLVMAESNIPSPRSDINDLKSEILNLKNKIRLMNFQRKSNNKHFRKYFILFILELIILTPLAMIFWCNRNKTIWYLEKQIEPVHKDLDGVHNAMHLFFFVHSVYHIASSVLQIYFRIPKKRKSYNPRFLSRVSALTDLLDRIPKFLEKYCKIWNLKITIALVFCANIFFIVAPYIRIEKGFGNFKPCPTFPDQSCCQEVTEDLTQSKLASFPDFRYVTASYLLYVCAMCYSHYSAIFDFNNFEKKLKLLQEKFVAKGIYSSME